MRQHTYTLAKGYEKSALHKSTVTWPVPDTIAEALAPNPDNAEGKPFFPSEQAILAAAVAQMNIRKGHGLNAEVLAALEGDAEKGVAARDLSGAEAEKIARGIVMGSTIRTRGKGKAVKEAGEKVVALTSDLSAHTPEKLAAMVTLGLLDQSAVDAELAKRSGGASQTATKGKNGK